MEESGRSAPQAPCSTGGPSPLREVRETGEGKEKGEPGRGILSRVPPNCRCNTVRYQLPPPRELFMRSRILAALVILAAMLIIRACHACP